MTAHTPVPDEQKRLAYIDRSGPRGDGRALPPPAVLGLLLTALAPLRGERALVVGAGTGYAPAVLKEMGLDVHAVEASPELAAVARRNGIDIVQGAAADGLRKGAPYDILLIDGAVEFIPDALVEQLRDGGRLDAAIVDKGITRLVTGRRSGGGFGYLTIADAAAPVLPGFERPPAFVF